MAGCERTSGHEGPTGNDMGSGITRVMPGVPFFFVISLAFHETVSAHPVFCKESSHLAKKDC
jgi:hypothetical protein